MLLLSVELPISPSLWDSGAASDYLELRLELPGAGELHHSGPKPPSSFRTCLGMNSFSPILRPPSFLRRFQSKMDGIRRLQAEEYDAALVIR